MRIQRAEVEGNVLRLTVEDISEARQFAYKFKAGEYSIKKSRKSRSNDANAYAWSLINEIAKATRQSNFSVYRDAVREVGGTGYMVCVESRKADEAEAMFTSGHLGRYVERIPSKLPGCVNLILHPGSSDFDTQQMSVLIDNLVQDCKALDIETLSDRELSLLKEDWNASKN